MSETGERMERKAMRLLQDLGLDLEWDEETQTESVDAAQVDDVSAALRAAAVEALKRAKEKDGFGNEFVSVARIDALIREYEK